MDSTSAAGPDGFGGSFYKACWPIIKSDFCKAVVAFFHGSIIPKVWTSTLIVTIPKVESPKTFSDLRPISLCNFNVKVLSKLLTTRLDPILPHLILEEQSGFTKGRSITDNVLLAQEMLQKIDDKVRGG